MDPETRALLVIGDGALGKLVELTLRHGNYVRHAVSTVAEARAAIEEWHPHLVFVNIDVEGGLAMTLIDDVAARERMAVIALTRRSDLRGKLDAF